MRRLSKLLLLALLLGTFLETPIRAAEGPAIDVVGAGVGNTVRVGHWTQVWLTITAGAERLAGRLELVAPDGDGQPARYGAAPGEVQIDIPAGESRDLVHYVKLGRREGQITARVLVGDRTVAERTVAVSAVAQPLTSVQKWILTYGAPVKLADVLRSRRATEAALAHESHVDSAAELPTEWYGYDGVDTLVITTTDPEAIDAISAAQVQALDQWVKLGGRLILSAGANAERIAATGAPLAEFVPGGLSRSASGRIAPGLETLARAEQPLAPLDVAELQDVRGYVQSYFEGQSSGQTPAIIRTARGFGQVTFLAFDIDRPPISDWSARASLLRLVLTPSASFVETSAADTVSRAVTHYGYEELTGQLRSALDYFPADHRQGGVAFVSFFTVALLLVVYLLCITLGDYFLLKRWLRRMSWTWVTFPLMVLLCCGLVLWLNRHWRGAPRVRFNQVNVIDVDMEQGTTRGTLIAHLYSPSSSAYDLGLSAQLPLAAPVSNAASEGALVSWQGLPGRGLGGFEMTMARPLASDPYLIRTGADAPPALYIDGLPVPVGATRSLIGRWWRFQPLETPYVLMAGKDGLLTGDLRNPLDIELEDVLLAYDRWAYRLEGTFKANAVLRVENLQRRDLEWRLTQRRLMHSRTSYSTTPWDPASRDLRRILEIMMFHQAAGGPSYTGLGQSYQGWLDMSEHLRLGRAVLVGRARTAAMVLEANGQASVGEDGGEWTWYRLVFPVQPSDASPSESLPR